MRKKVLLIILLSCLLIITSCGNKGSSNGEEQVSEVTQEKETEEEEPEKESGEEGIQEEPMPDEEETMMALPTVGGIKDEPYEIENDGVMLQLFSAYCEEYSDPVLAYRFINNTSEDIFISFDYGFYDEYGQGYGSEGDILYVPANGRAIDIGVEMDYPESWYIYGEIMEWDIDDEDADFTKGFKHEEYIDGDVVRFTLDWPDTAKDEYSNYIIGFVNDDDYIVAIDYFRSGTDYDEPVSETIDIPDVEFTRLECNMINEELYSYRKY